MTENSFRVPLRRTWSVSVTMDLWNGTMTVTPVFPLCLSGSWVADDIIEFKGRSDGQKWGNTSQNVSKSRLYFTLLYSKFMKRLVSAFCSQKRRLFIGFSLFLFFWSGKEDFVSFALGFEFKHLWSQRSASEAANHLSEPQKKLSPVRGREEEELSCSWAAVEILSCFCHRKLRIFQLNTWIIINSASFSASVWCCQHRWRFCFFYFCLMSLSNLWRSRVQRSVIVLQ